MKCPICSKQLKIGEFQVGEHRQTIFTCRTCDDFYNSMGLSIKQPCHISHNSFDINS